ncbi:MAG: YdcF family protein [Chloroflexi bacterium]|nr:YdcF family protein [Chloroflexota bacterium]
MFANVIIAVVKTSVRRRIWILPLCALVALLVVVGVLYQRVDAQAQIDQAQPVDAIIVLGSAVRPSGRASPSLNARIQHGIALYKAGYASHLILTGGLGQYPPTEAEVMRRLAAAAGVPAEAIVLEDTSHSTEEQLTNVKQIMGARGWRSALIVSDPFHLYRADMMARDLGLVAYGSPASNSPTYTAPHLRVWYTTREAIAILWYQATRAFGEPAWLYALLKGKV